MSIILILFIIIIFLDSVNPKFLYYGGREGEKSFIDREFR